jgi:hypothetical protein
VKTPRNQKQVIGVAWYRRDEWSSLREASSDRDDLEKTFEEWQRIARRTIRDLERKGIRIEKVDVSVAELVDWCKEKGVPVTAKTRSEFTAAKLHQLRKVEPEGS